MEHAPAQRLPVAVRRGGGGQLQHGREVGEHPLALHQRDRAALLGGELERETGVCRHRLQLSLPGSSIVVVATAAATSPPEQRPLWHLFIPLLAGLVVAETLGIVARQLVIEPGGYPGPSTGGQPAQQPYGQDQYPPQTGGYPAQGGGYNPQG